MTKFSKFLSLDVADSLGDYVEQLQKEIESGQAPYDQQQKLQIDFFEKRISSLEANIEKLKDKLMETQHQVNGNGK